MKQQTRTGRLLIVLQFLAWLAFIGFMVEAGAIMTSYFVSCVNPEAAKNLYKGLDLYHLRQFNFWLYSGSVFLLVGLPVMKASVSFLLIKTLTNINLKNPLRV